MTKSMDIVDFNPSDGFTPLQVQKLNWNFRKLAVVSSQVDVDQADAIKGLVVKTTDLNADQKMTVSKSGTKGRTVLSFGIPAAQVRITAAQVDSVLDGDAPTGDQVLNLSMLSRFWGGVKQYVDNAIGAIGAFVKKAGDTMTGDLVMDGASITGENGQHLNFTSDKGMYFYMDRRSGNKYINFSAGGNLIFPSGHGAGIYKDAEEIDYTATPSAAKYVIPVHARDKMGNEIGHSEWFQDTSGNLGHNFAAVRAYVNSAWGWYQCSMKVSTAGAVTYSVHTPAAFRNALGASSGIWPLALGGTATNNTNRAVNTVFAGPSSGSAGNASWRSLVAADIPNLNASKITAGTLARARGGTAVDNSAISPNRVLAGPSSGTDTGNATFRALVAADIPNLNASKITAGSLDPARGGTGRTVARLELKTIFSGLSVANGSNLGTNTEVFDYRVFIVTINQTGGYLFGYRTGSTSSAGYIYAGNNLIQETTGSDRMYGCHISVSTAGLCKNVYCGGHKIAFGGNQDAYTYKVTGLYGLY